MKQTILAWACFVLITTVGSAQKSATKRNDITLAKSDQIENQYQGPILFNRMFSASQYLADIDTLVYTLLNEHPSPFEFVSRREFWRIVNDKKKGIKENMPYREFLWHCSEIIANVNCGHTSLGWFNQERDILPIRFLFPIEGKFIDNKLYVSDPLINRDKVEAGREIFSINGKEVKTIQEEIYKHINSQGNNESYKRLLLNGYITSYIPYALGFPETYNIIVKGEVKRIKLKQLNSYTSKPRVDPSDECQDNLCFKLDADKGLATLTIRSFAYYGNTFSTYKDFIDTAFRQIEDESIANLIIDVRMNDGGPSDAGIHLLKYLYQSSFKYWSYTAFDDESIETYIPMENNFKGDLMVLMDGDCASTTPHLLSHIKQYRLGTLIGEESNGNHLTYGGQKWFQLPNTSIQYSVGKNKYVSAANLFEDETGILPDHTIVQSIDDYLVGKDTVMGYAKELIEKTSKSK